MSTHKICQHTGCSRYREEGSRYCSRHQQEQPRNIYTVLQHHDWSKLYGTSRWKTLSNECLLEHPICQYCRQAQSTEVHHIKPHRGNEELFYDTDNLVALCHQCHTRETLRERNDRNFGTKEEREMSKRYRL